MLDPARLLAASATVERLLWALAALLVVALLLRARRAPGPPTRGQLEIGARAERAAMLAVLTGVLVTRLVAYPPPQQPRLYYAQVSVVHIADALQAADPGRLWLAQLRNLQVLMEHDSPIQAPVAAALQRVLGPSIELPTIVGALWAVLAVVLAWTVGRAVESPAFGVLFAAFVAVSPLQIAWARIGGNYIGACRAGLFALCTG